MIKILIHTSDNFLHIGIKSILNEVFSKINKQIDFSENYDNDKLISDIIIISFHHGEKRGFIPSLLKVAKKSIIVLIDSLSIKDKYIPLCYQNVIFISLTEPISKLSDLIFYNWMDSKNQKKSTFSYNCSACRYSSLSKKDALVIDKIISGDRIIDIASDLGINYKTVCSHKYNVMAKFNLKNNYELITYMNQFTGHNGDLCFFSSSSQGCPGTFCFSHGLHSFEMISSGN